MTPLQAAKAALEECVRASEATRWYPSGPINEWAWTEEGRNHDCVMRTLAVSRAALARAGKLGAT